MNEPQIVELYAATRAVLKSIGYDLAIMGDQFHIKKDGITKYVVPTVWGAYSWYVGKTGK